MHRPHIRQHMEQNGVARLVVGRDALILLGDDAALLLRADTDLDKRLVDILLHQIFAVFLRGIDGRLVHQVLQIRPGETGGGLRHPVKIHVLAQRFILGVNL